ncbi:MAG: nucleotidyltransferase domain-containing protein, partial [Methylovulum sp.]|nr:nucleotidyltransferase domain-containing protein [Methylovulum sp.]
MTTLYCALFDSPDSLQQFKLLLKQNESELKQKFNPHESVSALIKERSDFIDNLLSSAWRHFLADYAQRFTLIAVGGYGRRELFPYSDIDIVVLLDSAEDTGYQEALVNL